MKMREGRGRAETAKRGARGSWRGQEASRKRELENAFSIQRLEGKRHSRKEQRVREEGRKVLRQNLEARRKRKKENKPKNELEGAEICMWVECLNMDHLGFIP